MSSFKTLSLLERAQQEEKIRRTMDRGARREQVGTSKKQLKRNLKPKAAPRRHWNVEELLEQDELGAFPDERIMPRDESERKRARERAAFRPITRDTTTADSPEEAPSGLRGLVVEVSTGLCRVDVDGRDILCGVRGALTSVESGFTNVVAVGDQVIISEDGAGNGIVEYVFPRRGMLARPDRAQLRQVIVANADQVLVVASWRDPIIWLELIDRYLIAAERSELQPILCVNKIDLVTDPDASHATLEPYRQMGYPVLLVSAQTGAGIDQLRELLIGRTTVLAGLSGVGKSSLIGAVQPGLRLRTGSVSVTSGEGRHTTTQATLLRLGAGGAVVDTPGIREFGLSGLRRHELAEWMRDFGPLLGSCRYGNCRHHDEPGCAIAEAVEQGIIARSRYHSYQRIVETLPN